MKNYIKHLFSSKSQNRFMVSFEVLNATKIEKKYKSIYNACEVLRKEHGVPEGVWGYSGKSKTKTVTSSYDKRYTDVDKVKSFLEKIGFELKKIKNKPFNKFLFIEWGRD